MRKAGVDSLVKQDYLDSMSSVLEIERAIEKLPPEEYGKLRDWIENYDLEQDAISATACIADLLDEEDSGEDQLLEE